MENINREDWLRISKSGCSLKMGWAEKRIVASVPNGVMRNVTEQWLDDAERLCDGWNELPTAKARIAELEAQISSQSAQPEPPASQELMDYVDRLEKAGSALKNELESWNLTEGEPESIKVMRNWFDALQSKPAKG